MLPMTTAAHTALFIAKWRDNPLSERAGAQTFFSDLCALLEVDPPNDPDNYCFERGATRTGAGQGWADVWKRGYFGWENKGPGGDLGGALKQLMTYALALDNPPLLVVSNRDVTRIHTHFTGTPSETHSIRLVDIGQPENLKKLRWLFSDPEQFRPARTVQDITAEAAGRFADLAQSMTGRGFAAQNVAHFLIQCLFCMFAEDIGLLPGKLFQRILNKRKTPAAKLNTLLGQLFCLMQSGGDFGVEDIDWFNGGLFAQIEPIELIASEVDTLRAASQMDWSSIEPAILGTLFERGLDPKTRAPLGANYTDPGTIMKLVKPVIIEPLAREWAVAHAHISLLLARHHSGGKGARPAYKEAQSVFFDFIERLKRFRVLDPACGSGNFLYLSLRALKDLEHRANLEVEALGLPRQLTIETGPSNVLGIEINAYAAELARVTVWIGEIQWMLKNGYDCKRNPILDTLNHIEHRDALLNADGSEATWPAVDVIVGNPPFLGGKKFISELGEVYAKTLRSVFVGRVPGLADLVIYWFEKARQQMVAGQLTAAGLVATNSVRDGFGREVLQKINTDTPIFEAWSDEPWVNEGAAVRVSLIAFSPFVKTKILDGKNVDSISSNLRPNGPSESADLTTARSLPENKGVAFQGTTRSGPFEIPGELARQWLALPNPNGIKNSHVVRPWSNGLDVTRRTSDTWIIDFGIGMTEVDACLYEKPFEYCRVHVKPTRQNNRNPRLVEQWWHYDGVRVGMRKAIAPIDRYIATTITAKYRTFVWFHPSKLADATLVALARSDDVTFGVLHSRFHELWSLRLGTSLEDRPRYTPTTCFETFPFPAGLTPRDTAQTAPSGPLAEPIAQAAQRLNTLRENWLNPAAWVDWQITPEETAAGFPPRPVAQPGHETELKKRTLTNLYNARPAWLTLAHQALDNAVAAAYGWADYQADLPDEEILRRLLALNLARAAAQSAP
jgi:hypothetical protein